MEELSDMNDFKNCNWFSKSKANPSKFHALTEKKCKRFMTMNLQEFPKSSVNELYRDFCVFLLFTK